MRYNAKLKERYDLSLDGKQVCALVVGALVLVAGTFVLGMSLGKQLAPRPEPTAVASQGPLARLDDPLPVVPSEEPPPALEAHDALVGKVDEALPTPAVNPPSVQYAAPAATPAPEPVRPVTAAAAPEAPEAQPAPVTSAPVAVPGSPPTLATSDGAASGRAASEPRHKAAAASRPAAPAKGAFTIQIGASSRRLDAERLAKRFEARRSRVIAADVPGKGRWYRVQVGSYPTRDAATRQLASLERAGVHGIVTAVR